jgi:hypothetical protein
MVAQQLLEPVWGENLLVHVSDENLVSSAHQLHSALNGLRGGVPLLGGNRCSGFWGVSNDRIWHGRSLMVSAEHALVAEQAWATRRRPPQFNLAWR